MSGEDQELSTRAVELACQFFENRGPDVTPGGMLEVAALIEGFLAGRFQVKYRPNFEPVKEGDDVFSLFSHVRAVVIDPGKPFERFVEKYDRLSEELKTLIQENHTLGKTCSNLTDDVKAMKHLRDLSIKEKKEAERKLALAMEAGRLAARAALICIPMLIVCVIALVWVLYFK